MFASLLSLAATSAGGTNDLEERLLQLAARAVAEGDLEAARDRYARALVANPRSARAEAGLGELALRAGDAAAAEAHFAAAAESDPESLSPLLGLAEIAKRRGDLDRARGLLRDAVRRAPLDPRTHHRLFEATGRAPPGLRITDLETLGAVMERFPYDPYVQLAAGRALREIGRKEAARSSLRQAVFAIDEAADLAEETFADLASVDAEWAGRRVVPVAVYADESVRSHPEWRFRMRLVWNRVSRALDPWLATVFVPISIDAFSTRGVADDLKAIHGRFRRDRRLPPEGIVAAFTEREPPVRRRTAARLGEAEFLGRSLVVRLEPGEVDSRVLAHELVHIYGGVHVLDDVESLMNPDGEATQIDPMNQRILRMLKDRGFGPGGFEENVFAKVDEETMTEAYLGALGVNLFYRKSGLEEAMEAARTSRVVAADRAREITRLDSHLGDVARLVAILLIRGERYAEAVFMLDSAARLFGPESAAGRAAQAESDRLRRALIERAREP